MRALGVGRRYRLWAAPVFVLLIVPLALLVLATTALTSSSTITDGYHESRSSAVGLLTTSVQFHPDEALMQSLALFPVATHPVSRTHVHQAQLAGFLDDWYFGRRYPEWRDTCIQVLVVGVLAPRLVRDDVLSPPPFQIFVEAEHTGVPSRPALGAYYVWDIGTRLLIAQGVLDDERLGAWNTWSRLISAGLVRQPCQSFDDDAP